MHARMLLVGFASLIVGALPGLVRSAAGAKASAPVQAGPYTFTGPYVHDNLAVFLVHGPEKLKGRNYLTLQEAMEKKIVIVHETGNVNELSIENVSGDSDVYIQSGDIVKGGRQDRTIAQDFIAPSKSGKIPINAFCVESGRWHQRGGESPALFASSDNAVAGKDLKLAAKQRADQGQVWMQVAANQARLSANAGSSVASTQSASSFELSLESKPLQDHTGAYLKELEPILNGKDDVIGYAFAINGKINSADMYANHALFVKLWPKLLKSSAVEAFAELHKDGKFDAATADGVKAWIADAQNGKESTKDIGPRERVVTRESEKNVVFRTYDRAVPDESIHDNYIAK